MCRCIYGTYIVYIYSYIYIYENKQTNKQIIYARTHTNEQVQIQRLTHKMYGDYIYKCLENELTCFTIIIHQEKKFNKTMIQK